MMLKGEICRRKLSRELPPFSEEPANQPSKPNVRLHELAQVLLCHALEALKYLAFPIHSLSPPFPNGFRYPSLAFHGRRARPFAQTRQHYIGVMRATEKQTA